MGAAAGEEQAASPGKNERQHAVKEVRAPPVIDTKSDVGGVMSKVGLKQKETSESKWNTSKLGSRLGVDIMCAAAAGGLVAPIVTVIDKSIIENASGKRPMMQSLRASFTNLLLKPHHFIVSRPFRLIFMVYGSTYLAANTLDTSKSTIHNRKASATTSGFSKFAATSTANLSLSLYKDGQFTKMFGTAAARPIPPVSYALFVARDCLTIFASFNLPSLIAPSLPLSEAAERYVTKASVAQFIAPAGIQLLSTPFHLMGLDMYNRNGSATLADRLHKVRIDWLKSSLARMCRIVPAFGVGGVVNTGMRKRFMQQLD